MTNSASEEQLAELRKLLEATPSGPVDEASLVESLLESCWGCFRGNTETSMTAGKLLARIENLKWEPPCLEFEFERHGGTVMGSGRAALHSWSVDINARKATVTLGRFRQLRPKNPPLDVKPIAAELAQIIIEGQDDSRVTWSDDGSVLLKIGKIIPDNAPKQTVTGRRERFRAALADGLRSEGWSQVPGKPNRFMKDQDA